MFPAFKEWHVIVDALLAGEQILILRKGGISEGRGGFDPDRANRFWLFPTQFHAQAEKTKPAAARLLSAAAPVDNTSVTLRGFADVVHHSFLNDWNAISRLDPFHLWTTDTVRERFDWAKPPGLHAFVVRAHRLNTPITFPLTAEMAGCKSWIELPVSFDAGQASPVLDDDAFAACLSRITSATC
jgi:hypothetical protein